MATNIIIKWMKRTLPAFILMLLALCCSRKQDQLQNGDLIFVGLPMGYDAETGSIDEAISSATVLVLPVSE